MRNPLAVRKNIRENTTALKSVWQAAQGTNYFGIPRQAARARHTVLTNSLADATLDGVERRSIQREIQTIELTFPEMFK